GFKSNRRQADEEEEGKVLDGIKATQGRMAESRARTIGELFCKARETDARARLHNAPDNYHWSFSRAECEDEFNKLWDAQQCHHPTMLTEELRQAIHEIIFRQIPFELSKRKRRKVIGRCPLEKYQPRCPLSSRLAQEFRILQQVNDFRIRAPEGDQTL